MEEILAAKSIEPINEDVDEMAKQDMMMKMVMKVSRRVQKLSRLTAVKITEWNPALEKIFSDMEECDPMLDRSLIFKRFNFLCICPLC